MIYRNTTRHIHKIQPVTGLFIIFLWWHCQTPVSYRKLAAEGFSHKFIWKDTNTLLIMTIGKPAKNSTGEVKRRATSKETALLSAQNKLVNLMLNCKKKDAKIKNKIDYKAYIKGGVIREVTYDSEDYSRLIYEIQDNGLQKRLTSFGCQRKTREKESEI